METRGHYSSTGGYHREASTHFCLLRQLLISKTIETMQTQYRGHLLSHALRAELFALLYLFSQVQTGFVNKLISLSTANHLFSRFSQSNKKNILLTLGSCNTRKCVLVNIFLRNNLTLTVKRIHQKLCNLQLKNFVFFF